MRQVSKIGIDVNWRQEFQKFYLYNNLLFFYTCTYVSFGPVLEPFYTFQNSSFIKPAAVIRGLVVCKEYVNFTIG